MCKKNCQKGVFSVGGFEMGTALWINLAANAGGAFCHLAEFLFLFASEATAGGSIRLAQNSGLLYMQLVRDAGSVNLTFQGAQTAQIFANFTQVMQPAVIGGRGRIF